ncbi:MAG: 4'-phosphopantetheinyl transferase superfamily protein [Lachnospiraceae bacterium]|nr:4'-phosphopantetheinyl transferase superfamily protein [Lachnospiraceae bacterium]
MADRSLIFITDTEELKDKELYENALELIDAGRRERVLKVRHEGSGRQMVAAGVLLQYAVREYVKKGRQGACDEAEQLALSDIIGELHAESGNANSSGSECSEGSRVNTSESVGREIAYKIHIFAEAHKPSGQPYLPDYPDIYISLSHSGARAMCGISDAPIGVDIQEHSERREVMDIAKRFFHEDEAAYLESISDPEHRRTEFYRLWCLHEAYVKNTGNGLSEGFKDVTFLDVLKMGKVCDNKYKCIIGGLTGYSAAVVMG